MQNYIPISQILLQLCIVAAIIMLGYCFYGTSCKLVPDFRDLPRIGLSPYSIPGIHLDFGVLIEQL